MLVDQSCCLNVMPYMTPKSRQSGSAVQPDLFGSREPSGAPAKRDLAPCEPKELTTSVRSLPAPPESRSPRRSQGESRDEAQLRNARVLTVEDMPAYPPDLVAAAKRSIKEVSSPRVLLTYKEIDGYFGISRATVARRLKDGLVPGIRILHGRVLEDGPVRRLDREQVLYLLLAVRGRRSHARSLKGRATATA